MASNVEAPERWYLALLGFAEHFRTSSPPKIRLCVHCLQAVFQFKPPQRIEARTHLQLGSVLYHHTKNSELARSHLEKAVRDARRRKERGWARVGTGSRPEAAAAGNCGYSYILFLLEKPELLRGVKCCIWYSLFFRVNQWFPLSFFLLLTIWAAVGISGRISPYRVLTATIWRR